MLTLDQIRPIQIINYSNLLAVKSSTLGGTVGTTTKIGTTGVIEESSVQTTYRIGSITSGGTSFANDSLFALYASTTLEIILLEFLGGYSWWLKRS